MTNDSWKEQAFKDQLSAERDFPHDTPVRLRYAICCGHRTGSNLLGEALYKTGQAGDPMEFLNQRFLKVFADENGIEEIDYTRYLDEMKRRRTTPNGVFGINIKFDQLQVCFEDNWAEAIRLIKENDYVLFLYRKDKLRQAISLFIAQNKDLYNVPAGVKDEVIADIVSSVSFNPQWIANCLTLSISIEQAWLQFFKRNNIRYEPLTYEEFVANYENSIDYILSRFQVPEGQRRIPEKPMKKVANNKNEQFRGMFLDYVSGNDIAERS